MKYHNPTANAILMGANKYSLVLIISAMVTTVLVIAVSLVTNMSPAQMLLPMVGATAVALLVIRRSAMLDVQATIMIELEARLQEYQTKFRKLLVFLEVVVDPQNPVCDLVNFCDEIAKWHDYGIGDLGWALTDAKGCGKYQKSLVDCDTLNQIFRQDGRNPYGINRTGVGETVTAEKVFLGGIHGLVTKPLSEWLELKDEPRYGSAFCASERSQYPKLNTMNGYDIVLEQASKYLQVNGRVMISVIRRLQKVRVL